MTASRFNGIPVGRYMLASFIVSGAIAGLGGSAELLGTQFRLINGFGAGYGFDGVAMALIGQLHPIATMLVALFFAVLRVGSTTMQAATGVPTSVSDIIQALVIVFSVAGMALTKLPEFEAWKNCVFGKRKEGAAYWIGFRAYFWQPSVWQFRCCSSRWQSFMVREPAW